MMTMFFTPASWYWKSDAGTIYSSASNAVISDADKGYAAWLALGNFPTVWPRDTSDEQTNDALNAVLSSFDLPAYAPKS